MCLPLVDRLYVDSIPAFPNILFYMATSPKYHRCAADEEETRVFVTNLIIKSDQTLCVTLLIP